MRVCLLDSKTNTCVNVVEVKEDLSDCNLSDDVVLAPDHSGSPGWKWTGTEWINPNEVSLTDEQMEKRVRWIRNNHLKRYVDVMNPVRWSMMSEEKKQEWSNYRQQLLDITDQSGFPNNVVWPKIPD